MSWPHNEMRGRELEGRRVRRGERQGGESARSMDPRARAEHKATQEGGTGEVQPRGRGTPLIVSINTPGYQISSFVAMILPRPTTSIQRATTKRRLTVSDPIEGVDNSKRLILTEEESEATQMIPTEFEGAGGTHHPVVIMSTKSAEAYRKMTEGGKVALVTCYKG